MADKVVAAVKRLWDQLPARVDPAQVPDMCKGFFAVVRNVYEALGRHTADENIDTVLRHGYVEGAEYNFELEAAPKPHAMGDPLLEHKALQGFAGCK